MTKLSKYSSDLDTMVERMIPFAVRNETRKKLGDLKEEYERKIKNLNDLLNGRRLGCPLCKSDENVVIVGNGRSDTKKFECREYHDPNLTGREGTTFRFSTYTSYEALKVYRDFLVEALTLLTTCEGTYGGIAKYLNISKHMVEFGMEVLLDYLGKEGKKDAIVVNDKLVVVYVDFSGTRVSRSASVIMSKVGEDIAYQIVCGMNYLTAWNFVRALKERLVMEDDATVVFVTDGEKAFVDPIRSFFPDAIHIRQFHSENSRGIVYAHFPFEGKLYTLRCLWNAVLEKREPNEEVVKRRKWRKLQTKKRKKKRDEKSEGTELFDGIILWEGVVYEPRGTRRKLKKSATVPGAMKERKECSDGVLDSLPDNGEGKGDSGSEEHPRKTFEDFENITPATDSPKRIFKGSMEEALQIPAVSYIMAILTSIFGGLYITSNAVECLFAVKPALKYHRTVKNGDVLVQIIIYIRAKLRKKSRENIKSFFREKVITLERLRTVAVGRNKHVSDKTAEVKRVVINAYDNGEPVVIYYRDAKGRRTSRMIKPLNITFDPYTKMAKVKSYCYLRSEERTFLLDRVFEAIPANTNISILDFQ